MREYGQIQCAFWSDPDIQGLPDHGKVLAAYLLTGPHSNGLGCYRLPFGYVQADFKWSSETVTEGFTKLFEIGFSERCSDTDFVLIPKFLYWNPISNANVAQARVKEFDTIPKKASIHANLCAAMITHGKHFQDGFINRLQTLLKGYGKQDPTLPNPKEDAATPPDEVIWKTGVSMGLSRTHLGKLVKKHGKEELASVIAKAAVTRPADPSSYIEKLLQPSDALRVDL